MRLGVSGGLPFVVVSNVAFPPQLLIRPSKQRLRSQVNVLGWVKLRCQLRMRGRHVVLNCRLTSHQCISSVRE